MSVNEKMTAIASAIRGFTETDDALTLDGMAAAIPQVYEAGRNAGGGGGYEEGYKAGVQAEYDRFWDNVQQNGNRNGYSYGFAGESWTDETYNPKYDIYCGNGTAGFQNNANNLFAYSQITDTKVTITFNATRNNSAFNSSKVVRIPLIKLMGNVLFVSTFASASYLEYIRFEGVIQNNIDFSSCSKLTRDSLMDIIEHLGSVSETRTCTLGSTNLAKLTDAEKAIATQKGWTLA